MTKQIIAIALLVFSTLQLVAQETVENKRWYEMKQINPNLKETSSIHIFDDPKKVYQLELKKNKPFNGYEISTERLLNELNFVNYYKDGERLSQYAIDYLQMEDQAMPIRYTLKTTFEKGKVVDGYVYNELPHGVLLIDQYKNGTLSGFSIDLFATHYFNRLNFQLNKEIFSIHNLQSNNELRVYKKEGLLQADFYKAGQKVAASKKRFQKLEHIQASSTMVYYINEAGDLGQFYCIASEPVDLGTVEDDFLNYIFAQFSFDFVGDMEEVLKVSRAAVRNFGGMKKNDLALLFHSFVFPFPEENSLGFLRYNADTQPWEGTLIKPLDSGKYEATVYESGKVQSTKVVDNLEEFRTAE